MFRLIVNSASNDHDMIHLDTFESEGDAEAVARTIIEADHTAVVTVLRPMARLKSATSVIREPIMAG